MMESQRVALENAERISTLKYVATFVDEKNMEKVFWDDLVDEEGKEFLDAVYNEYISWRDSFRIKDKESNEVKPTNVTNSE